MLGVILVYLIKLLTFHSLFGGELQRKQLK